MAQLGSPWSTAFAAHTWLVAVYDLLHALHRRLFPPARVVSLPWCSDDPLITNDSYNPPCLIPSTPPILHTPLASPSKERGIRVTHTGNAITMSMPGSSFSVIWDILDLLVNWNPLSPRRTLEHSHSHPPPLSSQSRHSRTSAYGRIHTQSRSLERGYGYDIKTSPAGSVSGMGSVLGSADVEELQRRNEILTQTTTSLRAELANLRQKLAQTQPGPHYLTQTASPPPSELSSPRPTLRALPPTNSSITTTTRTRTILVPPCTPISPSFNSSSSSSIDEETIQELTHLRTTLSQAQHTIALQHASLSTLHASHTALLSEHDAAHHALEVQASEMAALRSFLTKSDAASGADVLQDVADLNSAIVQLAAGVADAVETELDVPTAQRPSCSMGSMGASLGRTFEEMLAARDHSADPTLVQYALQAVAVQFCSELLGPVFRSDGPGSTGTSDLDIAILGSVYEDLFKHEPQATSSRWRALTYASLQRQRQRQAALSLQSGSGSTPTSKSTNRSSVSSSASVDLLARFSATLALAGGNASICSSSSTTSGSACNTSFLHDTFLHENFGPAAARLVERCEALADRMALEVMSARYVVVTAAYSSPGSAECASQDPGQVQVQVQVTAKDEDGDADADGSLIFDDASMDDVFASVAPPPTLGARVPVLCSTELGLVCVRRREASHAAHLEHDEHDDSSTNLMDLMERRVLLRPRVLLESVGELL